MSKLAEEGVKMTPQLSPKDIPQDPSDSEPEDSGENGLVLVDTSSEEDNGDESLMDPENNGYMPLVQDIADIADDEPSNQVTNMVLCMSGDVTVFVGTKYLTCPCVRPKI